MRSPSSVVWQYMEKPINFCLATFKVLLWVHSNADCHWIAKLYPQWYVYVYIHTLNNFFCVRCDSSSFGCVSRAEKHFVCVRLVLLTNECTRQCDSCTHTHHTDSFISNKFQFNNLITFTLEIFLTSTT